MPLKRVAVGTPIPERGCRNHPSDLSLGEGTGMTLPGARQKLKDNREATIRNFEIINRLKQIREELLGMRNALDRFSTTNGEER